MLDFSQYKEPKPHHAKRVLWYIINHTIFRCFPGTPLRFVRNAMLKMFGATIPWSSFVSESCDIWAPWNLLAGKCCIGPYVRLYNKDVIAIGNNVVISQYSHLCTAGHDISSKTHRLVTKPIVIKDDAWVAADAFVGMGVTIEEGAVVGARACVFKDVPAWKVVGGNPAVYIKDRVICRD